LPTGCVHRVLSLWRTVTKTRKFVVWWDLE
jgi:hypothetical protein